MKIKSPLLLLAGFALISIPVFAASPEQEKTFVDSYKKALEAHDTTALAGFLYTKGAQPEQVEFFKMMMAGDPGATVTSITLETPSAEEAAQFSKPMVMPDGKSYKMPIVPIKQLVIKTETKDANGSSSSTSKSPVAEKDGKLVIPVPVLAK
jgi:hypothetical protein